MEYVYAALLLHKLKQNITEDNIANIIKATGVTPDDVRVKALVAALSEVNIEEALKGAPVASVARCRSRIVYSLNTVGSRCSTRRGGEEGGEEGRRGTGRTLIAFWINLSLLRLLNSCGLYSSVIIIKTKYSEKIRNIQCFKSIFFKLLKINEVRIPFFLLHFPLSWL